MAKTDRERIGIEFISLGFQRILEEAGLYCTLKYFNTDETVRVYGDLQLEINVNCSSVLASSVDIMEKLTPAIKSTY